MIKSKNNKYGLRKTTLGVGSVLLGSILLLASPVSADDVTSSTDIPVSTVSLTESIQYDNTTNSSTSDSLTPTTTETTSNDTTLTADSITADSNSTTTNETSNDAVTEKSVTVNIYDLDVTNQKIMNTETQKIDLTNKESESVIIKQEENKYTDKGYVYDGTVDAATQNQTKNDINVTLTKDSADELNYIRLYRYTGLNTGDTDTLVKTDNSTKKDVYFVGATDKDGNALEKIGDTPYLETGSMYVINGVLVWCAEPNMPATAGQKYVAKVIDEVTNNALINNFGIGYSKYTKDNYFLVDIQQGMMWEAQGFKNIFSRVLINPDNTGALRNLTDDEQNEMNDFKEGILKAIESYKSGSTADFTYNGTKVSNTDETKKVLTFEEGSVPDSIELTGNAQILNYYKNGAIKTPDGVVLSIDEVKGLAKIDKLSSLKTGEYTIKMSMIRDAIQGDTTEWTATGQQKMIDYRIKDPKWETIKIKITEKPTTPSEEKPTTPSEEKPTKPSEEKPTTPSEEKPTTPSEEKPTTHSEEKPTTPSEEKPTKPTEEKPTTPSEEKPTTPSEEKPTTPSEEKPTKPTEEKPTTPSEEKPTTPSEEKPTTPSKEKTTTPSKEKTTTPTPTEEKTTTPSEEKPTTPSKEKTTTPAPTEEKTTKQSDNKKELPKTSDSTRNTSILGIILTTLGLGGIYYNKRKKS